MGHQAGTIHGSQLLRSRSQTATLACVSHRSESCAARCGNRILELTFRVDLGAISAELAARRAREHATSNYAWSPSGRSVASIAAAPLGARAHHLESPIGDQETPRL